MAVETFCQLRTQWRIGMSGATGLDYAALYPLLDRATADADEWARLFADVQTLEDEALEAMRET